MFTLLYKYIYFRIFLEKWAGFLLFLDGPDNTSCRYFINIHSNFKQCICVINLYRQYGK
ncbi:hypothetical protein Hanom_Chr05g00415921 [Helianthus anomalus]